MVAEVMWGKSQCSVSRCEVVGGEENSGHPFASQWYIPIGLKASTRHQSDEDDEAFQMGCKDVLLSGGSHSGAGICHAQVHLRVKRSVLRKCQCWIGKKTRRNMPEMLHASHFACQTHNTLWISLFPQRLQRNGNGKLLDLTSQCLWHQITCW